MTDRRCEGCAAFSRVREDERLGRVGECALQVFPPPLRASSTCSKWRPKGGAPPPPPKPRAAGEPRRRGGGEPAREFPPERPLPQEIDLEMDIDDFRRVLREVLRDEMGGLGALPGAIGARWQGGEMVLKPGREGTQEKRVPIESFFHKIVMVRDRLRVLEQKINANDGLSAEDKLQLQAYITGCYGSLTTFNVLFTDEGDKFVGAAGKD